MNLIERIEALRGTMAQKQIDAYIITGTDPHLSEYIPDYWKTREWISGFSGSYGRVVITSNQAALWTDSRYFLQAEEQLKGSEMIMMKDRQPDTISFDNWIIGQLRKGAITAVDGLTISAREFQSLQQKLDANGITLVQSDDLLYPIWKDRTAIPDAVAYSHEMKYAAISREEKFELIRSKLHQLGASATIITLLDDIAWSFNLRGCDIQYNPFVTAYGYISLSQAILFVDMVKIPNSLKDILVKENIILKQYGEFQSFLSQIKDQNILIDFDRTTIKIYNQLSDSNQLIDEVSIPTKLKSVKSKEQIMGMKKAHIRDGAAMVNFLHWFGQNFGKMVMTEMTVVDKLFEFRSQQQLFAGISFHPIVGFGAHGAIVHYSVSKASDIAVEKDGILLIDSGGHYLDGTTDITRTISTGNVTLQQKRDFTIVLKGMIGLANAVFPEDTKGYSLDSFARKSLWDNGINYGHGTGHGIGHFLSVHEGPMSIRQEYNPEPILEGQILSNEPAMYRTGQYGIRTENVILCEKRMSTEYGNFLGFETITLCPVDQKLVLPELLSAEERIWLNNYHQQVVNELSPLLDEPVKKWLSMQWVPLPIV